VVALPAGCSVQLVTYANDSRFPGILIDDCGAVTGRVDIHQRLDALNPGWSAQDAAGNGVIDPGETAVVAPTWRNTGSAPIPSLTGTASNFTGPVAVAFGGTTYTITDATADYGAVAACKQISAMIRKGTAGEAHLRIREQLETRLAEI